MAAFFLYLYRKLIPMSSNLFHRYIWLADTIYRAGRITFAEINRRWLLNNLSEGKPIPLRTFHKHREAVEEFFDIRIACYKPTNEYYIENKAELVENNLSQWLLNSFSASNMVLENKSIRNRILVEDVPSALRYLEPILEAIRELRMLEIEYHPFYLKEPQHIQLRPYFVKLYERRWYVYGPTVDNPQIKVYALDRIQNLSISKQSFRLPKGFSAEDHLATSIGITTYPDIPPRRIVIKCTGEQPQYLRALPLHTSLEEIEQHEGWSLFAYYLAPTNEFFRKILSHREFMEIVAPEEVRQEYAEILRRMLELHK